MTQFSNLHKHNKKINEIRLDSAIEIFLQNNPQIIDFEDKLNKFLIENKFELSENPDTEKIVYIYYSTILVYFKAVSGITESNQSKKLRNFIISSIRIIEYLIFLVSKNHSITNTLRKSFLSNYDQKIEYYFFMQSIDKGGKKC